VFGVFVAGVSSQARGQRVRPVRKLGDLLELPPNFWEKMEKFSHAEA